MSKYFRLWVWNFHLFLHLSLFLFLVLLASILPWLVPAKERTEGWLWYYIITHIHGIPRYPRLGDARLPTVVRGGPLFHPTFPVQKNPPLTFCLSACDILGPGGWGGEGAPGCQAQRERERERKRNLGTERGEHAHDVKSHPLGSPQQLKEHGGSNVVGKVGLLIII